MKQNTAFRRERKREKVVAGPGSRECKAGYETNNRGESRVRWQGLCALGEGGGLVKVGVAKITWPIQDIEKDGESQIKAV